MIRPSLIIMTGGLRASLERFACFVAGHEYVTVDANAGHHVCAHCGKSVIGFWGWM